MTSTMRKKILIGAGAVVGLLVVAVLVLPSLIDLNGRKAEIAAAVKKATGRDLVIDGRIALSLLPVPTVTLGGVKFFNAPGAQNPNMVEVTSVTVKPSIGALLTGNLRIDEVRLVEPKIVLEVDAQGKANWEFTPSVADARSPAPQSAAPSPPIPGRLVIDNGTLIFRDARTGLSTIAEKATVSASLRGTDGPYSLSVRAMVDGAPLKLDLSVGAKAKDGHPTDLVLEAGDGKLSFKGKVSELGPAARLSGIVSSSAENLVAFVETLARMAGQPAPSLPPLLAGKFLFDGAVDVSQTAISAQDFRLALGQDNATGSLALTLKPNLAVEGRLSAGKIDLDRWLAAMVPVNPPPAATPPLLPGATAVPAPPAGPSLLSAITARLAVEIGEVTYNRQPVRHVAIELEARDGVVAMPRLSATLPGDLVLDAKSTMSGDPGRPSVNGTFSLAGPKLRETLAWLQIDPAGVPPEKLARISLKGRMSSTGGNVQVSDAAFELDDLKGSGGVAITFSVPLAIVMTLDLDKLDLDSFLVEKPAGTKPAPAGSAAAPAKRAVGPTVGLKARIARLIWHKETIGGVEVDVALRGDTLRLNDIKVSNLVGARLAVRGTVADVGGAQPRPDLAVNFEAPDIDRVLKLLGATPIGLGAVAASGGVAGSAEQIALREVTVTAAGQRLGATGALALPGAAQGPPKSASYKGSLMLNGQALEGSVDANFAGRPTVNADLKATTLDLDRIGGGGAGGAAPPRAPARGAAAAAKPIDTGPLRSIDGTIHLAATSLLSPPLQVGNLDLAATLKDGVLTISRLKGSLYGGSFAFDGVVDASKPVLALGLKGDINGLVLGEMLRSTSGTNQFGGAIKVTIDGKLDATGLSIRGNGTTADQIKASLAGGAQLGGHIFVGADRALQVLGSAAAGVAGGIIDNTLGQALGMIGQNGLKVGNLLSAGSLVLNRFVNRDNPISGRIDFSGGVLTDRNLAVQGNRATANIVTRTDFRNATTDTTIDVVIAEDPSSPYLVTTARGAIRSPSFNVTRGSAKDPPGMASTLPGGGTLVPGQGSGGQQRSPLPIPLPLPNIFGR